MAKLSALDFLGMQSRSDVHELNECPTHHCAGEKNLIAEVIYRAMRDVLNNLRHHDDCYNRYTASKWLRLDRCFYEEDFKTPFSFAWCCLSLDLCPYQTRKVIVKFREEGKTIDV